MNKVQLILDAAGYVSETGPYQYSCNCISFAVDRAGIHDHVDYVATTELRGEYQLFVITKHLKDDYIQYCEGSEDISYAHSIKYSHISASFFDATYGTDSAKKRREALLAFAEYLMGNEP